MKRRILLVDDELAILLTLKAVLEMNDFEVETAASAREARSKLRASTFHMVITDMRMENESAGLEVVRAAKQVSLSAGGCHADGVPCSGLRVARRGHGRDAGQADEHHESLAPDRGLARHPRRQEAKGAGAENSAPASTPAKVAGRTASRKPAAAN